MIDGDSITVGIPDVSVSRSSQQTAKLPAPSAAVATQPRRILLPTPEEVRESYLEIRDVATGSVITVIELISPKNKKAGSGRDTYETKRLRLLSSRTNFVEIDLIRAGRSMVNLAPSESSSYSAVVSPVPLRPEAELYDAFGLQEKMPTLSIPLIAEDSAITLDLQQVLDETYDRAGLDLAIDYSQPPPLPKLSPEDQAWMDSILAP
jgi:hypothetical protein